MSTENKPLLSIDLMPIVSNIRRDKKTMTKHQIEEKYAAFKESQRTLFDLIMDSDSIEDTAMLSRLLIILNKKERGILSGFDADVAASTLVSDKYLYSSGIKRPDPEEVKKITERLRVKHDEEHKKPMPDFSSPDF